MVCPIP